MRWSTRPAGAASARRYRSVGILTQGREDVYGILSSHKNRMHAASTRVAVVRQSRWCLRDHALNCMLSLRPRGGIL